MSRTRGYPLPGLAKQLENAGVTNLRQWALKHGLNYPLLTRVIKGKPVSDLTAKGYIRALGCDLDAIAGSEQDRARAQARPGSVIVKRANERVTGVIVGAVPQLGEGRILVRLDSGGEICVRSSDTEPIGPEIEVTRAAPGILEDAVQQALIDWLEETGAEVLSTSRRRKNVTCPGCKRKFRPTGGDGVSLAVPDLLARTPDLPPFVWVGLEVKSQADASAEQAALAERGGIAIVGTHEAVARAMEVARSGYGSVPKRSLDGAPARSTLVRAVVEAEGGDFDDDSARLAASRLVARLLSACDTVGVKLSVEVL